MEYVGRLGGGAPLVRKYQVNSTFANAGVIARAPGAGNAGVVISTTTSAADSVGLALDTATYVTAQQTDGTSAQRLLSVVCNPDQILRALLSGGATEGTALTLYPVTTATTDGLDVTTASEWSSPTYDEGVVWFYDGANAGAYRKITSVSTTAGTVTVAFDRDHQVGDNALRAPFFPLGTATVTLTTNLTQVRADVAVATNTAELRCLDVELKDQGQEGRTKSAALFVLNDNIFNVAT
jgi:hypothetical protein